MGADAFIVFYGVRYEIPATDESLEPFEMRTAPLYQQANRARLKTYFDRMTDGEPYFFYVGTELGCFGIENDSLKSYTSTELQRIITETDAKLREGGFEGRQKLWLQLIAQY